MRFVHSGLGAQRSSGVLPGAQRGRGAILRVHNATPADAEPERVRETERTRGRRECGTEKVTRRARAPPETPALYRAHSPGGEGADGAHDNDDEGAGEVEELAAQPALGQP